MRAALRNAGLRQSDVALLAHHEVRYSWLMRRVGTTSEENTDSRPAQETRVRRPYLIAAVPRNFAALLRCAAMMNEGHTDPEGMQ